jgi:hypothetical protein
VSADDAGSITYTAPILVASKLSCNQHFLDEGDISGGAECESARDSDADRRAKSLTKLVPEGSMLGA